jgi:hypothetical protein
MNVVLQKGIAICILVYRITAAPRRTGKTMTSRPLTKGEIALAKSVFGSSIDYDAVYVSDKKFSGFHPEGVAMTPNGNLYMHGCYSDDYSAESTSYQGLFIHEMTHVWQFQNKILAPMVEAVKLSVKHGFNYAAAYDYKLDAAKDLLDYNMEQQASIVQDYFCMQQEGHYSIWGRCENTGDDADKRALFDKVLAKFHADPGYAKRAEFPVAAAKAKKPKGPGKV